MRQPRFWYEPAGLRSGLLAPLAAVWELGARRRIERGKWERVGAPVVCIGNLTVGGAGKTPTAAAIAQRLSEAGMSAHFLSRGYRGLKTGPILVDERKHRASEVGDEALLLAAFAPTWVSDDRLAGAKRAVESGAEALILDDGHQDPSLARDLSLIVADASAGFGNGRAMPAGPLREKLADGLSRSDMVVVVGSPVDREAFFAEWGQQISVPLLGAELRPLPVGIDWSGMRVVAFAGIGYPEKFFATLRNLGAEVMHAVPLSDHQPLTERLLIRLERKSKSFSAQMVTTEKDAVRLSPNWRTRVLTLPVRLEFENRGMLDERLSAIGMR